MNPSTSKDYRTDPFTVRAKLLNREQRLEDHCWSSYREYLRPGPPAPGVVAGGPVAGGSMAYRRTVRRGGGNSAGGWKRDGAERRTEI